MRAIYGLLFGLRQVGLILMENRTMEYILAGLGAGFLHVLAGPDHLAAITPFATRHGLRSWLLGFKWGLGHTGGVLIVGAAALLFRGFLPIDALSSVSERLVGVVLIAIGLWMLKRAFDDRIHLHDHSHPGGHHTHFHVHDREGSHGQSRAHTHSHTAVAVGTLHGLAGSSHLLGILPALALPSNGLAAAYLAAFGGGTILGMVCFSHIIGCLSHRFAVSNLRVYRGITATSAVAAIGIGCVWLIL